MGKHDYRAAKLGGEWAVLSRNGAVLYDSDGDEMTQQEADDLAWAFNNSATSDEMAIKMIVNRYQRRPEWLIEDYPITVNPQSVYRGA